LRPILSGRAAGAARQEEGSEVGHRGKILRIERLRQPPDGQPGR